MAEAYFSAGGQDTAGKCAKLVQDNGDIGVEIDVSAFKISGYLLLKGIEKVFVVLWGRLAFQEPVFEVLGLRQGQVGSQKAFFSAGKAEIAPFGPENYISYHFLHFESYLVLKCYEILLCNNPNSLTQAGNFVKYNGFYKKWPTREEI